MSSTVNSDIEGLAKAVATDINKLEVKLDIANKTFSTAVLAGANQSLPDDHKAQARVNIGAVSADDVAAMIQNALGSANTDSATVYASSRINVVASLDPAPAPVSAPTPIEHTSVVDAPSPLQAIV